MISLDSGAIENRHVQRACKSHLRTGRRLLGNEKGQKQDMLLACYSMVVATGFEPVTPAV